MTLYLFQNNKFLEQIYIKDCKKLVKRSTLLQTELEDTDSLKLDPISAIPLVKIFLPDEDVPDIDVTLLIIKALSKCHASEILQYKRLFNDAMANPVDFMNVVSCLEIDYQVVKVIENFMVENMSKNNVSNFKNYEYDKGKMCCKVMQRYQELSEFEKESAKTYAEVNVCGMDGSVVKFRTRPEIRMGSIMRTYCKRQGLDIKQLRFRGGSNAVPLHESMTFGDLNIKIPEDNPVHIDVFTCQCGC